MNDVAKFFRILADEARLKMLWLLFNHKELCVCDFLVALDISQSKASRHLRTLLHGGLVTDRKAGLWSYYSLCPLDAEIMRPHMKALRASLAKSPDADVVLKRLHDWLQSNRTMPVLPWTKVKWMKRKDRETACADDCACSTTTPKDKAAPTRAPRKGGTQ